MRKKTVEDYLRVIYRVFNEKEIIKSVDVAKRLKVTKATVSDVLRSLEALGYVVMEKYQPIKLTEQGIREAKRIEHKHLIIEYFLKETLKCDLDLIHNEAHDLEHAFSNYTIMKLDKFLGYPKISPHGKKIR